MLFDLLEVFFDSTELSGVVTVDVLLLLLKSLDVLTNIKQVLFLFLNILSEISNLQSLLDPRLMLFMFSLEGRETSSTSLLKFNNPVLKLGVDFLDFLRVTVKNV